MPELTAEKLAQRAFDSGLLADHQIESVWSEAGSRECSYDDMVAVLLRRGLLTNYQINRLASGERFGYFYGKYKVLYLVGTGTFARVYRAVNIENERVFAVKVLRKRYRDNPVELEQFLREGRMGLVLRHPNVVPIYEMEGDPRNPFMVMEFVEGQTLREMLRIRGTLDFATSLHFLTDIVAGLAYAFEQGITHRDLKLSNVLISSSGRAKLVDFGLATAGAGGDSKLADCPNARAIDYAALERGTGVRKDDPRSDLFFAGCIMYSMLSGRPPLTESNDRMQRLNISRFSNIPSINSLVADLPPPVGALVNRAMEIDPTKRFSSAAEMLEECRAVKRRLDAGDDSDSNGEASQAGAAAPYEKRVAQDVKEGQSRTVMLVESRVEMQDLLRSTLKKRGYRVLIISDPQRALERFAEDSERTADVVVFSALDLEDAALDAFNQFGKDIATEQVPAILLVDQHQAALARRAARTKIKILLPMPLKVRQLRAALLKLTQSVPAKRVAEQ